MLVACIDRCYRRSVIADALQPVEEMISNFDRFYRILTFYRPVTPGSPAVAVAGFPPVIHFQDPFLTVESPDAAGGVTKII